MLVRLAIHTSMSSLGGYLSAQFPFTLVIWTGVAAGCLFEDGTYICQVSMYRHLPKFTVHPIWRLYCIRFGDSNIRMLSFSPMS